MTKPLPAHVAWIQTKEHGSLRVEFFNARVVERDGYEFDCFGIANATRKDRPVDLDQEVPDTRYPFRLGGVTTLKASLEHELISRYSLPPRDYVFA